MEAANSQLQKEFLENLGQIATHADTADFTIACDGDEHRVHKLILSLHSKYFARLFKGGQFKENGQNRINLVDDPKIAVKHMIDYLYTFEYNQLAHSQSTTTSPEVHNGPHAATTTRNPIDLHGHAYVYTLGDKYDIPGLRTLAQQHFENCGKSYFLRAKLVSSDAQKQQSLNGFLAVIPYVYMNSAPNDDKGLRHSVVKLLGGARELLNKVVEKKTWQGLAEKCPEFGADMIAHLCSMPSQIAAEPEMRVGDKRRRPIDDAAEALLAKYRIRQPAPSPPSPAPWEG